MLDPIVIDFETWPILRRPNYPPKTVGCAFDFPGMPGFYIGHDHQSGGNNGTFNDMMQWLWKAWQAPNPKLFHNSKYDIEVAVEGLDLPMLPWDQIHDSMFLAYLMDPHARRIGLKELAEDLLNWPPEEKDAMTEWVQANKKELLARWPEFRRYDKKKEKFINNIGPSETVKWTFAVPGDIAGAYAVGDVQRTRGIFNALMPVIEQNGMREAYDRERRIMPIFADNERRGMRVDLTELETDTYLYERAFDGAEEWLRNTLGNGTLNFDADADVAEALIRSGTIIESDFPRTEPTKKFPNGQLSTSKEVLVPELFTGPNGQLIASVLGYRNRLKTCLTLFMKPWLEQASINNGYITTNWNQTRGNERGGTRTGRPSTYDHNLLNIIKKFMGKGDGYVHPEGLPELPLVRKYIYADDGHVFLHRDFSGQELRLFAHFEQGDLYRQYHSNPRTDPHQFVGEKIAQVTGDEYWLTKDAREMKTKTMNFQSIYGGGIPAMVAKLRCSHTEAKQLKQLHNEALPGRQIINDEITRVIRRGEPIRTWGGRLYWEEPRGADGRSKIYKLINYLIQGSAADLTKQSIIDWHEAPDRHPDARLLITVYDENNISVPIDFARQQMQVLRREMERDRLTVPMLSDGKWGYSWGKLEKYEDG